MLATTADASHQPLCQDSIDGTRDQEWLDADVDQYDDGDDATADHVGGDCDGGGGVDEADVDGDGDVANFDGGYGGYGDDDDDGMYVSDDDDADVCVCGGVCVR